MKTIGLIGGTTWLSTIDYYRIINQEVTAGWEPCIPLNYYSIQLTLTNSESFLMQTIGGS